MENIKEIPYGIANFEEVAEQNKYYVDKTMYLPLLEKQPPNMF
ncbi:AAA family ATPase, partial [Phocaeicola vulgatus]